jgi:hypothetical protein
MFVALDFDLKNLTLAQLKLFKNFNKVKEFVSGEKQKMKKKIVEKGLQNETSIKSVLKLAPQMSSVEDSTHKHHKEEVIDIEMIIETVLKLIGL